jgi:adenine-specific DNA-methyltransferase
MDKQQPEKLIGASLDVSANKRSRLKQLFPSVFTETKNEQGELVESIDFAKLKAELGAFSDLFENRRERYGMDWPGKKEALRLIQSPSHATLKPSREESVDFDTTENLYIEGDNLEVLKLLQKSYYGKVKMIYIDPPYNTGNEFIYPDNYTENLHTYLEYAKLVDSDGKKFSTNTANEGRFHTRWLNMMYPRLYLARNLLRDDGVIFISIDDNEVSNLRKLCDEIFGEDNFVENVVWQNKTGAGAKSKGFIGLHEYVLCYAKKMGPLWDINAPMSDKTKAMYSKRDEHYNKLGPYATWPLDTTSMDERANLRYPIIYNGHEIWPRKQWLWSRERVEKAQKENKLVFNFNEKQNSWSVRFKGYLYEENGEEKTGKPTSLMLGPYTQEGTKDFQGYFNREIFPFPKPVAFIKHLLSNNVQYTNDTDVNSEFDIILDFFAGSATTAHAILDMNKKDNGNRKYILVQLPEHCARDSEAFKAGYKTIADIGKERIRRVIKKLNEEQEGKLDLENDKEQDRGFRVLKLNQSNFKQWRELPPTTAPEQILEELELHIDHISHTATQEDLLFEILLKAGFMPAEKAAELKLAGKKVFSVAGGALLICLEDIVSRELIDEVAAAEPQQFICLDAAFGGNDQLKANTVQTFAALNMQKETHNQIVFRTV